MACYTHYILGLLIISSCFVAFSTQDTPVLECSNNVSLPLSVRINDCSELPCVVQTGTTATIEVNFIPPTDNQVFNVLGIRKAKTAILYSYIQNPCSKLTTGSCPLKKDILNTFVLLDPVADDGVKGDIEIILKLLGDNFNELFCFAVPLVKT